MKKLFLISTLFLLNAMSLYGYEQYCRTCPEMSGKQDCSPTMCRAVGGCQITGKPIASPTFAVSRRMRKGRVVLLKTCDLLLTPAEITYLKETMKKTKAADLRGTSSQRTAFLQRQIEKEYNQKLAPFRQEYEKKVASIKQEYEKKVAPIRAKHGPPLALVKMLVKEFQEPIEKLRSAIDKASTSN